VVKTTQDRDFFVRTQAVLSLGFAQDATTVEALKAVLGDGSNGSEIRLCAAAGLGLIASPESIQVLEQSLRPARMKHLDHVLQAGIVYAAGVAGEAAPMTALQVLEKSWLGQQDARLRSLIAVSYGRSGTKAGLDGVLRLLADTDSEVRRSAAAGTEGVAHLADAAAAEVLVKRVSSESDLSAKASLCRAMGRVRLPETREFLRNELSEGTTWVRPHVALALGLDGDPGNGDLLLEQLTNLHELNTRGAVITALALMGDERVVPILIEELDEAREPVYLSVLCRAAGLMGTADPAIVERLVELANTVHNVEVARLAVLALGLLGQREAVAALAASAAEVLGTVDRAGRIFALGQVGDRDTIGPLLELVGDERQPSYVIAYAVQALGEVCDARTRSPAWRLSRYVNLHHDVPEIFELYRVL
jgi:HEAT repeat protein